MSEYAHQIDNALLRESAPIAEPQPQPQRPPLAMVTQDEPQPYRPPLTVVTQDERQQHRPQPVAPVVESMRQEVPPIETRATEEAPLYQPQHRTQQPAASAATVPHQPAASVATTMRDLPRTAATQEESRVSQTTSRPQQPVAASPATTMRDLQARELQPRIVATGSEMEVETMVHQLDPSKAVMIPAGVRFEGNMDTGGKAAVVVFGTLDGTINAGEMPVYVASGGAVEGVIVNRSEVVIAGRVTASRSGEACIKTSQRVVVGATGRIDGDVMYGSLRIYDGVISGRMMPFADDPATR